MWEQSTVVIKRLWEDTPCRKVTAKVFFCLFQKWFRLLLVFTFTNNGIQVCWCELTELPLIFQRKHPVCSVSSGHAKLLFCAKICLTCMVDKVNVHKSYVVKSWKHKRAWKVTSLLSESVSLWMRISLKRSVRETSGDSSPAGPRDREVSHPALRSLNWGYNVAASRVHYSLFSSRAHQNDFPVTNHSNEMEPSQQILKASGVKERCSTSPTPAFWCRACVRKSWICIKTASCQGGWGHGLGWRGLGWRDQMFALSQCNFQLQVHDDD